MARSVFGLIEREARKAEADACRTREPYAVILDGAYPFRRPLRKAASYVAAHAGAQVVRTVYPEAR